MCFSCPPLQSTVELKSAEVDLSMAYNNGSSLLVCGRVRDTKRVMTKPAILRYMV